MIWGMPDKLWPMTGTWEPGQGLLLPLTTRHRSREPLQVRLKCLRRAFTQLRRVSNFLMTEQWQPECCLLCETFISSSNIPQPNPTLNHNPLLSFNAGSAKRSIRRHPHWCYWQRDYKGRQWWRRSSLHLNNKNQPWQFFCMGVRRHHLSSRVSFTLPTCYSLIISRLIDQNYKVTQTYFWQS